MDDSRHGCKLFYCTRRKAYVCCFDCEKMKKQERRTPAAWKRRRAQERQKMAARWMREDADRRLLPKFQGAR